MNQKPGFLPARNVNIAGVNIKKDGIVLVTPLSLLLVYLEYRKVY